MKYIVIGIFILFTSKFYCQSQVDTLPYAKHYYVPKLSQITKHLKDVVGFNYYILKSDNQNAAWVKIISPAEEKTNSKGKKYSEKGYVRLEYFEFDCVNERIRSIAIFYFDNQNNLQYACTEVNDEFRELEKRGPYEVQSEIFDFVCRK